MKLLVCGGRDFRDYESIYSDIEHMMPDLVITGGARGADTLADKAAEKLGIPRVIYPANWTGEGSAAGPNRNRRMLELAKPDLVMAYAGGRGTTNMIMQAAQAGVEIKDMEEREWLNGQT